MVSENPTETSLYKKKKKIHLEDQITQKSNKTLGTFPFYKWRVLYVHNKTI